MATRAMLIDATDVFPRFRLLRISSPLFDIAPASPPRFAADAAFA